LKIKFLIRSLILLMLLASSPGNAADALSVSDPPPGTELQLFIENDMLARTDRYYTNGIKFGVGLPFDLLQFPAASMLRSIDPDNGADIHVGLFLGQNIYTPRDITIAAPQPDDRPWAAWLYLGGVAQRVRGNRLDTAELDLGFVGPAALGKPVQKQWHRLIGVEQPRGWDNQSRNEPAFMLSYLQKRRFGNRNADLIVHGGATIGTVMTLVRSGVMVRFGQRMTGFGPDTIEPGGAMLRGTRSVDISPNNSEWFAFAGMDHRLVARNAFLDGPVFSNGPSLERRNHVFDLSLGFSARLSGFNFSWTRILRSEEFLTTTGGGGKQRFDSINIGFEF
jgi:lipid A 3-O-deacylase